VVEERESTHDETKTVMKPLADHQAVRSALPLSYGCLLAALAIVVLVATVLMGLRATTWSGASFPGFFVLPNRVVASIGEPHWTGSKDGSLYQRTVVAVDGAPVANSAEVYQRIGQRPSGTTFAVTLQQGSTTDTVSLRSMEFSWGDYSAIFGAYLATGVLYLMMGLLGAWLLPGTHLGRALLFVGSTGGIYTLSAIGIYEPYGGFRIHALAEAFFPAGVVYLGFVFPRERGALVKPGMAVATGSHWGSPSLPASWTSPVPAPSCTRRPKPGLLIGLGEPRPAPRKRRGRRQAVPSQRDRRRAAWPRGSRGRHDALGLEWWEAAGEHLHRDRVLVPALFQLRDRSRVSRRGTNPRRDRLRTRCSVLMC
jgi:hypothetical protein